MITPGREKDDRNSIRDDFKYKPETVKFNGSFHLFCMPNEGLLRSTATHDHMVTVCSVCHINGNRIIFALSSFNTQPGICHIFNRTGHWSTLGMAKE